jgi:Tol biopolymer transport system component
MENSPAYAAPGWLLFTRDGVLEAQPFDAQALRTTGEAMSLGDEPGVAPGPAAYDGGRRVSASASGSLAYVPNPAVDTNVQWIDQTGKLQEILNVPAGRYTTVAISPDNARAVLVRRDSAMSSRLWLADLTRASAVPLSVSVAVREPSPIWSPDSKRIVFMSDRDGHNDFYEMTIADSSPERRIFQSRDRSAVPRNWSGAEILFNQIDPGTKWNIYRLPASGAAEPVPVVRGPAIEVGGWLSPNGRWLAYQSDETGHLDLFVQSFPAGGTKLQIPTGGSQLCWWARDGKHLLFLKRDQTLWRVDVDLGATTPHVGVPQQIGTFSPSLVTMDLAPDNQRFLAIVPEHAGVATVTIVQSWRAALTKH